jgi:hypothetical protein
MNWIIYVFGSGAAFFLGMALLFISLAVFTASSRRWIRLGASLLAIIGCLLVALSATPLPYWLYLIAGVMTLLWLACERAEAGLLFTRRNLLRWAVAAVWGASVASELPYQLMPQAPLEGGRRPVAHGRHGGLGFTAGRPFAAGGRSAPARDRRQRPSRFHVGGAVL